MRVRTVALTIVLLAAFALSAADKTRVVVASDGKTQITVPTHWTALELNEAAEIQVGDEKDEAYLIVLNESKEDLNGWNLEKHSRVTLGSLLASLSFPTVSGPTAVKIGGSPAVQYEIRGSSGGTNVVYLHTTVDGPKHFSQILAWTLPSRVEKVRPQLVAAVNTFREK